MKRLGLIRTFLSATLFLVLAASGLRAQMESLPPPPSDVKPKPAKKGQAKPENLRNFDQDGDGLLDDRERAEAKKTLLREMDGGTATAEAVEGAASGAEAFRRRLMEMFDQNRDGRLDEAERAAAQKFVSERGPGSGGSEMRAELMKRFDVNGNGRLDPEERVAVQEFFRGGNELAAQANAKSGDDSMSAASTDAARKWPARAKKKNDAN